MEKLLGLPTINCGRYVVSEHPNIDGIYLRKYVYTPRQISRDGEVIVRVSRDCFLNGFDPHCLIEAGDEKSNVALDSPIEITDGNQAFFLMMDLELAKSPDNQDMVVAKFMDQIFPIFGGGFLIETARSYQFLGEQITDYQKWQDFMSRWLLMNDSIKMPDGTRKFIEISDTRYIGYSLLRRTSGLRVTTRDTKTFEPKCIAIIN